jgi:hypothetical protein
MTKITDIYELYSFIIYLYGYGYFYSYIFNQSLVKGLFINISANLFSNYLLNTNILKFITHSYWRNNINSIVMPQLISSFINIITSYHMISNNIIIVMPINIVLNHLISKMYTNEINYSKNIRYLLLLVFLLLYLF